MQLPQFDADQIKRASDLLHACGIEPTAQTMLALVETADAHYPGDPTGLEKAAQALVAFFEDSANTKTQKEPPWHRLRHWAFSMLRL
ncbi:hypothetical protein [Stenomitos frigidus]|uniref:Uncharacterized protein n=2 Tax=Stenomitos TaxID=1844270 RepID=A0A2T1ED79_9CYAN|nr:hypothetical protein C7B82_08295 [Stenomitos frigidus ULC18]